jgi:hypothetical protein
MFEHAGSKLIVVSGAREPRSADGLRDVVSKADQALAASPPNEDSRAFLSQPFVYRRDSSTRIEPEHRSKLDL